MRAIVIEDELNVREGFLKLINAFCPEINVIGVAASVEEGLQLIHSSDLDLLFLDINLPDGSGFDLVHRLESRNFHIIFVTAYDQYAIDAFKISAVDYLLKPVSPDLLKKAIQKIEVQDYKKDEDHYKVLGTRLRNEYDQDEKIILKDSDSMRIVTIRDIIYCEAEGSYTTFYFLDDTKIVTSMNLKEYERLLEPYGFERSHHSYLINLDQVVSLQKMDGGTVMMTSGMVLPLSTRKKSTLMEALKDRFVG